MRTQTTATEPEAAEPTDVVALRLTVFDALCNARNLTNDLQRAKALGISHSHLGRIRSGHVGVGGKFIGRTLKLLGVAYEVLFENRPAA